MSQSEQKEKEKATIPKNISDEAEISMNKHFLHLPQES